MHIGLPPYVLEVADVLPEIVVGDFLRRLVSRSQVGDVSLIRVFDELAARAQGIDGDEVMRSMAIGRRQSTPCTPT